MPAQPADDHANDASSATSISYFGSPVQGPIEVEGDEDWFSFEVSDGNFYRIETTLMTLRDTVAELHDQNGTTRIAIDDDGGKGLASRIDFVQSDGDVVIVLTESDDGAAGLGSEGSSGLSGGCLRCRCRPGVMCGCSIREWINRTATLSGIGRYS